MCRRACSTDLTMDIVLGLLAILFAFPTLTGYFAHSYGRSFRLWFVLAMVLPLVSWFLLTFLSWRQEEKEKKRKLKSSKEAAKQVVPAASN